MYNGMIYTKKFRNAIGGIEVSREKKEQKLQEISTEIERLNTISEFDIKSLDELSYIDFAISYPESLNLVKDYYDALLNAKVRNIKVWDGSTYINRDNKIKEYENEIKRTMIYTLIIFGEKLMKMDLLEIKEKFNLTSNEVLSIFNHYKRIVNDKRKIADLDEENMKYDLAKLIYTEIVINDIKKEEFCKKYNISDSFFDVCLEILKNINEVLYNDVKKLLHDNVAKRFNYLKELINKIGIYSDKKIKVNTEKGEILMPFTILDYYSMTKYPVKKTLEFAEEPRNFWNSTKDERKNRAIARKVLLNQKNVGLFVSKQQVMDKKMIYGTSEKMVEMTEEICDEIFKLFDAENIPKSQYLIDLAFKRYALGQPIFPLKQVEQSIDLEEDLIDKIGKGKN